MGSSRKNKTLYIDTEALSSLALVQEGLIAPVTGLMGKDEATQVDETQNYQGVPLPFSFILAPTGSKNKETLTSVQIGETIDLINEKQHVGTLKVEEVFPIDPTKRLANIYGTSDPSHPGVRNTKERLGDIAVSGPYRVKYPIIKDNIRRIKQMKEKTGAKKVSAMMMAANPLNRAHERIIRQAISESDMLVIFLRKPFTEEGLRYDIRLDALETFIENFLPPNKVLVIPFENTYIFAGHNELILDALLAKNYGCDQLIVGKNHGGLGLYYDQNRFSTVFDLCQDIGIEIKTIDEYVYCDTCKTLVSTQTCPHGQHHHIHYHSASILKLIQAGVIPPPILVRKEVSANILSALFPNRFENLEQIRYSLMPGTGLLEEADDELFYRKLIELYQTTSLT